MPIGRRNAGGQSSVRKIAMPIPTGTAIAMAMNGRDERAEDRRAGAELLGDRVPDLRREKAEAEGLERRESSRAINDMITPPRISRTTSAAPWVKRRKKLSLGGETPDRPCCAIERASSPIQSAALRSRSFLTPLAALQRRVVVKRRAGSEAGALKDAPTVRSSIAHLAMKTGLPSGVMICRRPGLLDLSDDRSRQRHVVERLRPLGCPWCRPS